MDTPSSNDILTPAFNERNVPVFCSTDDNFAPYCGVMLQSLIDHTSSKWNYDIIVLHSNLSAENRQLISSLTSGIQGGGISIRFYDASAFVSGKNLLCYEKYPLTIWYRVFAPSIFSSYKKIIYLDVDVVVQSDVAELYSEDIGDSWLAGCRDMGISADSVKEETYTYLIDTIGVENVAQYINTGVLILNISRMLEAGVEQACINAALKYQFLDQHALNHVCHAHIHQLDLAWNVFPARGFEELLKPEDYRLWEQKKQHPRIIHYVGYKPWVYPFSDMASVWWQAAARTPYFDKIYRPLLLSYVSRVVHYKRDVRRYWVSRLLSKVAFGKLKIRLIDQKRSLSRHLSLIRSIMKEL